MAYANIGTPRFYVNEPAFLRATGAEFHPTTDSAKNMERGVDVGRIISLNPTDIQDFTGGTQTNRITLYNTNGFNFIFYLGHNIKSQGALTRLVDDNSAVMNGLAGTEVNYYDSTAPSADYDGWSLKVFDNKIEHECKPHWYTNSFKMGAIVTGVYYDMPHSPDLNLKMTIEMDGIKNIQSKGGATLSNASYTKPADWGDAGAWQLGGASNLRSGRRVWDLSFSYLSDTDVFPVNAGQSHNFTIGSEGGYHTTTNNPTTDFSDIASDGVSFSSNILDGQDFFSVVWNKTMGGHLPFIFQPDGGGGVAGQGNFNPDQFAIARFDMNSLQYDQVANNVYNVKLKIRESW